MKTRRPPSALRARHGATAVGVLIVAVALYALVLSYNADEGLPLQNRYELTVEVPDAAQLSPGDQVRIGGARVGAVQSIRAVQATPPFARIVVSISGDRRLPVDSTVTIRPISILGAKSVQLQRGRSTRVLGPGTTLPLAQARPTVDLADALSTFDPATRRALRGTVGGLGDALAGRGPDVNRTIGALAPLLPTTRRVADALAAPSTRLSRLLDATDRFTAALDPVSGVLPELTSDAATTFAAVSAAGSDLDRLLDDLPVAVRRTTGATDRAGPVLSDLAAIGRDLRTPTALLPATADRLDGALVAGVPTLRQARTLNRGVRVVSRRLSGVLPPRSSGLSNSLLGLRATVRSVSELTAVVGPAQRHCNVLGLQLRNGTDVISDGDADGSWFSFIPMIGPTLLPAAARYDTANVNYHPTEDARGCAAGNTPYTAAGRIGNPSPLPRGREATPPPRVVTDRARAAGLLTPVPGTRLP